MSAYYNEIDAYAAQWLRNLIAKDLIAKGDVDERSICNVDSDDLKMYRQCHFFAGIGGWSHALRLAGWPDDRPIWTGSCPCQPFSVAGKGAGTDDPRHLWPDFHRLIAACRPPVVMGEQVAGKAGYGWFDGVRFDLEGNGYSSRAVDIPALAVGAPHIRQRLYWVACDMADAFGAGQRGLARNTRSEAGACSGAARAPDGDPASGSRNARSAGDENSRALADPRGGRRGEPGQGQGELARRAEAVGAGGCDVADALRIGRQGPGALGEPSHPTPRRDGKASDAVYAGAGFWSNHEWILGADGKARRTKSGICLLADGVPSRVGKLRAYGNAIVPPLAAEMIKAFMECEP